MMRSLSIPLDAPDEAVVLIRRDTHVSVYLQNGQAEAEAIALMRRFIQEYDKRSAPVTATWRKIDAPWVAHQASASGVE